jgi:hypothetical protein
MRIALSGRDRPRPDLEPFSLLRCRVVLSASESQPSIVAGVLKVCCFHEQP